jgi:flavin reductase (DIM6/NTAB) family NADH-FMN oxidoreductase RutF
LYPAVDTHIEFADAMSALASGVVVVTSRFAGRPWGMTVTALASVSADPPTVLVSLGAETVSARSIVATGAFGVSILADTQVCVASHASAPGNTKFLDAFVERTERRSTSPPIANALAHLDCEVVDAVEAADHIVFFGRVHEARRRSGGAPLLYHGRGYTSLRPATERNLRCLAS